jgi:hypothetical protein
MKTVTFTMNPSAKASRGIADKKPTWPRQRTGYRAAGGLEAWTRARASRSASSAAG